MILGQLYEAKISEMFTVSITTILKISIEMKLCDFFLFILNNKVKITSGAYVSIDRKITSLAYQNHMQSVHSLNEQNLKNEKLSWARQSR